MTVATKSVLQIRFGPLQKQKVSLATEQSLQSLWIYLFTENVTVIASQRPCFSCLLWYFSLRTYFCILPTCLKLYLWLLWLNTVGALSLSICQGSRLQECTSTPTLASPSFSASLCSCAHTDSELLSVCGAWTWALWWAKYVEANDDIGYLPLSFSTLLPWDGVSTEAKTGCLGKAGWPGRSQDLPIWAPDCWSYRQDSLELLR